MVKVCAADVRKINMGRMISISLIFLIALSACTHKRAAASINSNGRGGAVMKGNILSF